MLAVTGGVGLSVAVLVEARSVDAANESFNVQMGGGDLDAVRVVGPTRRGGITPSDMARIESTAGVATAVPVVQAITLVETGDATRTVLALGIDCRSQALVGQVGCVDALIANAKDSDPPILSDKLAGAIGAGSRLRTDHARIPIDPERAVPQLDALNDGGVVALALPVAQRVFDRGDNVDVVYVRPQPGVSKEELRQRLVESSRPQLAILRPTDRSPGVNVTGQVLPLIGVVGLFAVGIGAILVFNIVGLSVAERRRDLAVVAALGGSPRTAVFGVLGEAAVLGTLGGILGGGVGVLLAQPLVASMSTLSERFVGLRIRPVIETPSLVSGILMGVVVAVLAALVPAWRAGRTNVVATLTNRDVGAESRGRPLRGRAAAAVIVVGIAVSISEATRRGGGLAWWQSPTSAVVFGIATVATLLAVTQLTAMVLGIVNRRMGDRAGVFRVALANIASDPRRTSVMASAVAVAVALSTILAMLIPAMKNASSATTGAYADGRVAVNVLPFSDSSEFDAKLSPELIDRLARIPGVAAVERESYMEVGSDGADQIAVTAAEHPTFPFAVVTGDAGAAVLARGDVLVGAMLARERDLAVGSTLSIPTGNGDLKVTVGAIWENANNAGRIVTVPWQMFERIWGPQPPDPLFLRPAPGVTVDQLASNVRAADVDPALRVATPTELAAEGADSTKPYLTPFWALQRGLLLVAFIATTSSLLLIGLQRRREVGVLSALGLSPAALGRLAIYEAGAVGIVGALLGAAGSLIIYEALRNQALFLVGFRPPFDIDIADVLLYVLLSIAVVLVGTVVPAIRTARQPIVEALQYE
ncbi:ABC transporter permease [Nocardia arthritidis]|uniref:FtsX-like permease family protein n=1 Tax=Nocardia arthritidis TaxID=228602 RepID=A0A6G9YE56_9NOCA|nr:FtsX-like permease family protein [Nocardia arthritidis]QIS11565.1 FtsX-like permease family protein [Nocardia arthritidis]